MGFVCTVIYSWSSPWKNSERRKSNRMGKDMELCKNVGQAKSSFNMDLRGALKM